MPRARLVAAVALAAAAVFSGCPSPPDPALPCESNLDCRAPGTRCDLVAKHCVCATDAACPDGQFCNHGGVCQVIAGCQSNSDCAGKEQTYCDVSSGRCLKAPAAMLGSECGL